MQKHTSLFAKLVLSHLCSWNITGETLVMRSFPAVVAEFPQLSFYHNYWVNLKLELRLIIEIWYNLTKDWAVKMV